MLKSYDDCDYYASFALWISRYDDYDNNHDDNGDHDDDAPLCVVSH